MKLCQDCKYYKAIIMCIHPYNGASLLDGKPKPKFATTNRDYKDLCGYHGNWFEPKAEPRKPWYKRIKNAILRIFY